MAIFSDDTAADVRDHFTDLAAEGLIPGEATKRLISESADILDDDDEAIVFWLALAATQWKLGRLVNNVRIRALKIIDSGADLARWTGNTASEVKQRTKRLAKLRQQLLSPQAKPKKLKPRVKSTTDFKPGDIAVFRLDGQTAVRFCVLHLWSDRGGTYTDICLLGLDDEKPWRKKVLKLSDTLGPHYTMLSHEPADSIKLLRRDVAMPPRNAVAFRAWNNVPVRGHACSWDRFPSVVRDVLVKLD